MPINILMPALSPTMDKGNLAKWVKKEGDKVSAGDILAEIETDKATMEFEAVDDGTLGKILVPEGTQDVAINQPIAILLQEGEDKSALKDAGTAAPAKPAEAAKPPATPAANASDSKPEAAAPTPPPAEAQSKGNGAERVFASPLARRLAKDGGIDIARVSGSGPHGRVVKADVEATLSGKAPLGAPIQEARSTGGATAIAPSMNDAQIMKFYAPGSYDVVPHDNVRKIIARRLVEAKQTIPHYYLTIDTEIDALLKLRADINDAAPRDKDGNPTWKVSVNDLVIKALAMALMRVPDANVTWTDSGMLHHHHADVGVAVAIPGGLITPVVRHADEKRVSEIAIEMKDFAARARGRKLLPEEYQGGSTAVSNLGMFGIKDFAAVINPPHATLLAIGAGTPMPVVRDGEVVVRTIMTCTLSADHRAVDGALGAELLAAFKALIEKPAGMLA